MVPLFRKLIIISNVAFIVWFFLPLYSHKLYTYDVQKLLDANAFNALDILLRFNVEINYINLALYLISAVGMYFFIRKARTLFLVLTIFTFITPLFAGVSVQSPIDVVLNNVTLMADAAILYMSYYSSVASKFNIT